MNKILNFLFLVIAYSAVFGQQTTEYIITGGIQNSNPNSNNVLSDAIASLNENGTITIKGDVTILTDFEIPKGIELNFFKGNKLIVDTGFRLTINGSINSGIYQIFDGEGKVSGNPTIQHIYPQWFGAIGNGLNNDTLALQKCLDFVDESYGGVVDLGNFIYKITNSVFIYNKKNLIIQGQAELRREFNSQKYPVFVLGENNSGGFKKCENITIKGLFFNGSNSDDTNNGVDVGVSITADSVYSESSGGCSNISIKKCSFTGFNIQVIATGTSGLNIHNNKFKSPLYIPSEEAGGYGILTQSCYNFKIFENDFIGTNDGSRHAIYISFDQSKPKGNLQYQTRDGKIFNNYINWENADDLVTNFYHAINIRSPRNLNIHHNRILSKRVAISVFNEENDASRIRIENNEIESMMDNSRNEFGAINVYNAQLGYKIEDVIASNNKIEFGGFKVAGIRLVGISNVVCKDNTIKHTYYNNAIPQSLIYLQNLEQSAIGNNTLINSDATKIFAYILVGKCDLIQFYKDVIINTNFWRFVLSDTSSFSNFSSDFPMSAIIHADGNGSIVVAEDPYNIINSVSNDNFGVEVSFKSFLKKSNLGFINSRSLNSQVSNTYVRSIIDNNVVIGVQGTNGAALPASINNYKIVIDLIDN
ncbi:hypothetical protein [Aquimarina aggregata]|uniref:hypothetical protein n=1 Tax=Aquimarina aggregata TaxID=1642818 RepID=UPI00249266CB|nr:hypothetical protein [Aquimarina aggregata]